MNIADPPEIAQHDKEVLKELGYDTGVYIGEGSFGQVFNGVCNEFATKTYELSEEEALLYPPNKISRIDNRVLLERSLKGRTCAIKRIIGAIKGFLTETSVLMSLSHPNIVEVFNSKQISNLENGNKDRYYIIMEYINGSDLAHAILNCRYNNQIFMASEVKTMFTELIYGLSYLHNNGVVHGDIRLENIMLHLKDTSAPNKRQIKYVDFGLAIVSKLLDPERGVDIYPPTDIRKLSFIFNSILDVSDLETNYSSVYFSLRGIGKRMQSSNDYHTVDQLCKVIDPVLDRLPSDPLPQLHDNESLPPSYEAEYDNAPDDQLPPPSYDDIYVSAPGDKPLPLANDVEHGNALDDQLPPPSYEDVYVNASDDEPPLPSNDTEYDNAPVDQLPP